MKKIGKWIMLPLLLLFTGITFVACGGPTCYTVTFDSQGGSIVSTQDIENGSFATKPDPDPVRTGYTFDYWETLSGERFEFDTIIVSDTALFAKWAANSYEIILNKGEGVGGSDELIAVFDSEMPADLVAPHQDSYLFAGYYSQPNGTGLQYYDSEMKSTRVWNIAENTMLYAKWKPIDYRITYENLQGGTHSNPASYTTETNTFTFTAPVRTGYIGSWDSLGITQGSMGDVTITAQWVPISYEVQYSANGGEGTAMSNSLHTYDLEKNLSTNTYTREGYIFNGWNIAENGSGKAYTEAESVLNLTAINNHTVTIYAQWTTIEYSITYENLQGGTHLNPASYTTETNTFTFAAPIRTGYNGSWDIPSISHGSTGNKTITAQWIAKEYTVFLNYAGADSGNEELLITVTYDSPFSFPVPERVGYNFMGWYTAANGGRTQLTGADGISIADWNIADFMTAYAYWSPWQETQGFTFGMNDILGGYCITSASEIGNVSHVVIPSSYNGVPVVGISFWDNQNLVSIYIPATIREIGQNAFRNCSNLTTMVFESGSNLTTIASSAFEGCTNLSSFTIPSKVKAMGDAAFKNCTSLNSVLIPASVTTLGILVFQGCTGLAAIDVAGSSNYFSSLDGVVYNYSQTELLMYPASNPRTSYKVPAIVTKIGNYAFWFSENLTSITFENGSKLITIGNSAFSGCSLLTSMNLPSGVTTISDYTFSYCSVLTSINIPSGVTGIGDRAFFGCSLLTSMNLPSGVTTLGSSAFSGMGITSIHIPAGVTKLDAAFNNCANLSTVTFENGSKLQTLGYLTFQNCVSLNSITIPASVTLVEFGVFWGCINLSSIYVDNANGSYVSLNGILFSKNETWLVAYPAGRPEIDYVIPSTVTNFTAYAFRGSVYLTSVIIPSSVISFNLGLFYDCKNLETVVIENGVTEIGQLAFEGCINLQSITIPSSVDSLSDGAFTNCVSLTSFTISSNVTSIGQGTFYGCTGITSIIIPYSVRNIGRFVFDGWTSDQIIYIEGRISKPSGWAAEWKEYCNAEIVWDYILGA